MTTASRSSESERDHDVPTPWNLVRPQHVPASERAQASPTATLVAVAAIGMGLSLYASVLGGVAPTPERAVAEPALDRVDEVVTSADIADPEQLERAADAGPDGYQLRVSLRADGRTWVAGPTPPSPAGKAAGPESETANRPIAVRTGPGTVAAGRLRVVVWR